MPGQMYWFCVDVERMIALKQSLATCPAFKSQEGPRVCENRFLHVILHACVCARTNAPVSVRMTSKHLVDNIPCLGTVHMPS